MKSSILFGLCGAALLAGPVFGHAKLVSSSPAADAQLTSAPASLTLTFNENVKLAILKITTAGHEIPLSIDRRAAAAPTVTVSLPVLTAGKYEVQWSALTVDDGHVAKGSYTFIVR
jgi:copper resistance protein C